MFCSLLRLSCRKMGAQSGIGLNSSPKWLNSAPKWLSVIINDDFLEEGECYGRLALPYAQLKGLYPISDNYVRK